MKKRKERQWHSQVEAMCPHEGCVRFWPHRGMHSLTKPYAEYKQGPISHQMASPDAIPKMTKGDTHRRRFEKQHPAVEHLRDAYGIEEGHRIKVRRVDGAT